MRSDFLRTMYGILFTTTSCPKCPAFREYISEHVSFPVDIFDERHADFQSLVGEHDITAAPTLILCDESRKEVFRTSDASELSSFLSSSPDAI